MNSDPNLWIAFGALLLTSIAYAVSVTIYTTRIELRAKDAVDASKELLLAVIERELAKEQKARHDLANHIHTQLDSLDRDYRSVSERMAEMVHKSDLAASENRLMGAIDKLEKRLETGGRLGGS